MVTGVVRVMGLVDGSDFAAVIDGVGRWGLLSCLGARFHICSTSFQTRCTRRRWAMLCRREAGITLEGFDKLEVRRHGC